jgi:hypothetical protein
MQTFEHDGEHSPMQEQQDTTTYHQLCTHDSAHFRQAYGG